MPERREVPRYWRLRLVPLLAALAMTPALAAAQEEKQPIVVPRRIAPPAPPAGPSADAPAFTVTLLPGRLLPSGASLFRTSGDVALTTVQVVDPKARDKTIWFSWDVTKVPEAGGVIWQVSRLSYPGAGFPAAEPPGLLTSGKQAGQRGSFPVDFGSLAVQLGLEPGPRAPLRQAAPGRAEVQPPPAGQPGAEAGPPAGAQPRAGAQPEATPGIAVRPGQITPPGEEREGGARVNVAVRGFLAVGGGVTFHVRVIPIRSPADSTIVGMASNVMEVVYGSVPPPDPIRIHATVETGAAGLRLVGFDYQPYRETYPWPPGCYEGDEPPDDRTIFEKAIDTLVTVWDAISAAYDEAKSAVVSAVGAITFGLIPPEHLEFALTTALIAAGIPPDMPNLDELMDQGAGYLAAAVAEQVVGPAAGEITAQLAAEYANHPIGQPLTEEVRRRVTEEIEERSKQAILDGARAAREAALKDADKRRCGWKSTMPALTLTFRNDGPEDYRHVAVRVSDYNAVFQPTGFELFIDRGETLTVPLPLLPQVRELVRSQLVDRDKIANTQLWWSEIYPTWRSRFSITTISQRMCSPGAPCTETWRELYGSPNRVWNTAFAQEL